MTQLIAAFVVVFIFAFPPITLWLVLRPETFFQRLLAAIPAVFWLMVCLVAVGAAADRRKKREKT